MGCVKIVCSSSSGNNGAFVNDISLDICFKVQHYISLFFEYLNYFFIDKSKAALFEWAVRRLFVHLRVEIMALLSMSSDWIFVRLISNACSKSVLRLLSQFSLLYMFY